MQAPINMALYRLLLQLPGVSEADAEEAARIDTSELATKADLLATKADLTGKLAELKVDLLKWVFGLLLAQTGLLLALARLVVR